MSDILHGCYDAVTHKKVSLDTVFGRQTYLYAL
jgi:hypothetical protein